LTSHTLQFFRSPEHYAANAGATDWTQLLTELRKHGLLAKAYFKLYQCEGYPQIPLAVRRQLGSGARYAAKQQQSLFAELMQLEMLVQQAEHPCLLLKGAAYRALALPVSFGRLFSDIDVLVPAAFFTKFKNRLFFKGFYEPELPEYDRQYYLRWSHQHPPLQHFDRDTVIDLHHQIFPAASATKINIERFFLQAEEVAGSAFKVPCLEHMFIHASVHLFWQEETHRSLKDIIDLNELFLDVVAADKLESLAAEAQQTGTVKAVNNVIYVLGKLFKHDVAAYFVLKSSSRPQRFISWLFFRTLTDAGPLAAICKMLWFVRGHSLKMRWYILLYHSVAKPAFYLKRWLFKSA
jgi:hypothetical protein